MIKNINHHPVLFNRRLRGAAPQAPRTKYRGCQGIRNGEMCPYSVD